jgi:hypothetical protein
VYPAEVVRQPQGAMLVYEGARETGVYEVHAADGRTTFYVVQPDRRESDLKPCADADRDKVANLVPMTYQNDLSHMSEALSAASERQEVWWWFLVGVIVFLCGEVWMTRRIVRGR